MNHLFNTYLWLTLEVAIYLLLDAKMTNYGVLVYRAEANIKAYQLNDIGQSFLNDMKLQDKEACDVKINSCAVAVFIRIRIHTFIHSLIHLFQCVEYEWLSF